VATGASYRRLGVPSLDALNSLKAGMSDYLIREIEDADNVGVRLDTKVVGGSGKGG